MGIEVTRDSNGGDEGAAAGGGGGGGGICPLSSYKRPRIIKQSQQIQNESHQIYCLPIDN